MSDAARIEVTTTTTTRTTYRVFHTLPDDNDVDLNNLPPDDYLGLYDDEILKRIAIMTLRYELDCAAGKYMKNIHEHMKQKAASRKALTEPSYWSGMILGVLEIDEDEFMCATKKLAARHWRGVKRYHGPEGSEKLRGRPRTKKLELIETIEQGNG